MPKSTKISKKRSFLDDLLEGGVEGKIYIDISYPNSLYIQLIK